MILSRKMEGRSLVVGYVGVSTKSQGRSGISLDAQRVDLHRFADVPGYKLMGASRDIATWV